jgi:hypothetical protein
VTVFAIALTRPERDLLVTGLRLLEEHDASTELTRPLLDMLERVPPLEELRQALEAAAA